VIPGSLLVEAVNEMLQSDMPECVFDLSLAAAVGRVPPQRVG
jgi:hypothetical protein